MFREAQEAAHNSARDYLAKHYLKMLEGVRETKAMRDCYPELSMLENQLHQLRGALLANKVRGI